MAERSEYYQKERESIRIRDLIHGLSDPQPATRASYARELGKDRTSEAVEPLIALLNDCDARVRQEAVEALGKIADIRAVEPLIVLMKEQDGWPLRYAAQALGQIGDLRAVDVLLEALKTADAGLRRDAAEALGRLKDLRAFDILVMACGDSDDSVRRAAVGALAGLNDARAAPTILAKLRDRSVTASAACALGELRETRAIKPLTSLLGFRRWIEAPVFRFFVARWNPWDWRRRYYWRCFNSIWIRKESAIALGKMARPLAASAISSLVSALSDPSWDVRSAAADTLGAVGGERAIRALKRARGRELRQPIYSYGHASQARGDGSRDHLEVTVSMVRALARLGDSEAVSELPELESSLADIDRKRSSDEMEAWLS